MHSLSLPLFPPPPKPNQTKPTPESPDLSFLAQVPITSFKTTTTIWNQNGKQTKNVDPEIVLFYLSTTSFQEWGTHFQRVCLNPHPLVPATTPRSCCIHTPPVAATTPPSHGTRCAGAGAKSWLNSDSSNNKLMRQVIGVLLWGEKCTPRSRQVGAHCRWQRWWLTQNEKHKARSTVIEGMAAKKRAEVLIRWRIFFSMLCFLFGLLWSGILPALKVH